MTKVPSISQSIIPPLNDPKPVIKAKASGPKIAYPYAGATTHETTPHDPELNDYATHQRPGLNSMLEKSKRRAILNNAYSNKLHNSDIASIYSSKSTLLKDTDEGYLSDTSSVCSDTTTLVGDDANIFEHDYANAYIDGAMELIKKSGIKLRDNFTFAEMSHINGVNSKYYGRKIRDNDPTLQKLNFVQETVHRRKKVNDTKKIISLKNVRHKVCFDVKDCVSKLRDLYEKDPNGKDVRLKPEYRTTDALNIFFKEKFNVKLTKKVRNRSEDQLKDRLEGARTTDKKTIDEAREELRVKELHRHIGLLLKKGGVPFAEDKVEEAYPVKPQLLEIAERSVQEELSMSSYARKNVMKIMLEDGSFCERMCDKNGDPSKTDFKLVQPYGKNGETYQLRFTADGPRLFDVDANDKETAVSLDPDPAKVLKAKFDETVLRSLFGENMGDKDLLGKTSFEALYSRLVGRKQLERDIYSLVHRPFKDAVDKALANCTTFYGTGFSFNNALYGENLADECRTVIMKIIHDKAAAGDFTAVGSCGFQQDLIWHAGGHIIAVQDVTGETFLASPHGNDPYTVEEKLTAQSLDPFNTAAGVREAPWAEVDDSKARKISAANPIPQSTLNRIVAEAELTEAGTATAKSFKDKRNVWKPREVEPLSVSIPRLSPDNEVVAEQTVHILDRNGDEIPASSRLVLHEGKSKDGRVIVFGLNKGGVQTAVYKDTGKPFKFELNDDVTQSDPLNALNLSELTFKREMPEGWVLADDEENPIQEEVKDVKGDVVKDADGNVVKRYVTTVETVVAKAVAKKTVKPKKDEKGKPVLDEFGKPEYETAKETRTVFELDRFEQWTRVPMKGNNQGFKIKKEDKKDKDGNIILPKEKQDDVDGELIHTYEKVVHDGNPNPARLSGDRVHSLINCVHTQNGKADDTEIEYLKQWSPNVHIVGYSVRPSDQKFDRSFILGASKDHPDTHSVHVAPNTPKQQIINEAMIVERGRQTQVLTTQNHVDMLKHEGGPRNPYYVGIHDEEIDEKDVGRRDGIVEMIDTGIYNREVRALHAEIKEKAASTVPADLIPDLENWISLERLLSFYQKKFDLSKTDPDIASKNPDKAFENASKFFLKESWANGSMIRSLIGEMNSKTKKMPDGAPKTLLEKTKNGFVRWRDYPGRLAKTLGDLHNALETVNEKNSSRFGVDIQSLTKLRTVISSVKSAKNDIEKIRDAAAKGISQENQVDIQQVISSAIKVAGSVSELVKGDKFQNLSADPNGKGKQGDDDTNKDNVLALAKKFSSEAKGLNGWRNLPKQLLDEAMTTVSEAKDAENLNMNIAAMFREQAKNKKGDILKDKDGNPLSRAAQLKARNDATFNRHRKGARELIHDLLTIDTFVAEKDNNNKPIDDDIIQTKYEKEAEKLVQELKEIQEKMYPNKESGDMFTPPEKEMYSPDEENETEEFALNREINQAIRAWEQRGKGLAPKSDDASLGVLRNNALSIAKLNKAEKGKPKEEDSEIQIDQPGLEQALTNLGTDDPVLQRSALEYMAANKFLDNWEFGKTPEKKITMLTEILNSPEMKELNQALGSIQADTGAINEMQAAFKACKATLNKARDAADEDTRPWKDAKQRSFSLYGKTGGARNWLPGGDSQGFSAGGAGVKAGAGGDTIIAQVHDVLVETGTAIGVAGNVALSATAGAFSPFLFVLGLETGKKASGTRKNLQEMAAPYKQHAKHLKEVKEELQTFSKEIQEDRKLLNTDKDATLATIQRIEEKIEAKDQNTQQRIELFEQGIDDTVYASVVGGTLMADAVGVAGKAAASALHHVGAGTAAVLGTAFSGIASGSLTLLGMSKVAQSAHELYKGNKLGKDAAEFLGRDSGLRVNYNTFQRLKQKSLVFQTANWSAFTLANGAGFALLFTGPPGAIIGGTIAAVSVGLTTGMAFVIPKRDLRRMMRTAENTPHLGGDFFTNPRRINKLCFNLLGQMALCRNTTEKIVDRAIDGDAEGEHKYDRSPKEQFRYQFEAERWKRWIVPDADKNKLIKVVAGNFEKTKDLQYDRMLRTTDQEFNFSTFRVDELVADAARLNAEITALGTLSNKGSDELATKFGALENLQSELAQVNGELQEEQARLRSVTALRDKLRDFGVNLSREWSQKSETGKEFDQLRMHYMVVNKLLAHTMSPKERKALIEANGLRNIVTTNSTPSHLKAVYHTRKKVPKVYEGKDLEKVGSKETLHTIEFNDDEASIEFFSNHFKAEEVNEKFAEAICYTQEESLGYEFNTLMNLFEEQLKAEVKVAKAERKEGAEEKPSMLAEFATNAADVLGRLNGTGVGVA